MGRVWIRLGNECMGGLVRLLEFESKEIMKESGIAVPEGTLILSPGHRNVSLPCMLKARIPHGGQKKAGGGLVSTGKRR